MHNNVLFLVLTFVVILIIVFISETLTVAVLTISLLTNMFIISGQLEKRKNIIMSSVEHSSGHVTDAVDTPPKLHDPTIDDKPEYPDDPNLSPDEHPYAVPEFSAQPTNIYGSQFMKYDAYKNSARAYDTPLPDGVDGGINPGIDGANALMARKRTRDKQCMDGAAVKDANFYKFHYADELDEAEQKAWWGNAEW